MTTHGGSQQIDSDDIVNGVVVEGPDVARARRVAWYSWRSVPAVYAWTKGKTATWPTPARLLASFVGAYATVVWAGWLISMWACALFVLAPYWLWILAGSMFGRGIRRNVRLGIGDAVREREA